MKISRPRPDLTIVKVDDLALFITPKQVSLEQTENGRDHKIRFKSRDQLIQLADALHEAAQDWARMYVTVAVGDIMKGSTHDRSE